MWTYILRRLLLMIPTMGAILLINFAILRMGDDPLRSGMSNQGTEDGAQDPALLGQTIESSIRNAALSGRHLPAVINLRGFLDKNDILQTLQRSERIAGKESEEADRRKTESGLWISGPFAVKPLIEIIQDDSLRELHAPASYALSFTAYRPLDRFDLEDMNSEERSYIRNRNSSLKDLRISYVNNYEDGYLLKVQDAEYNEVLDRINSWWERYQKDFTFESGEAYSALFLETGFVDFFGRFFTGRLESEQFKRPVWELIGERWYISFWLQIISVILAWSIALPLGIRSARRKDTLEDKTTSNALFLLWSMPEFFIGSLLLFYFCTDRETGAAWFPNKGLPDADTLWSSTPAYLWAVIYHGFLPLLVLSYNSFTVLSRFMRGSLLDQMGADYARTARAKGCTEDQIVYGHLMRNSMLTMVTMGSGLLAALFGGFVVVEMMFSINGLGLLLLDAARAKDAPLVMASTIVSVSLLLFSLLVADLMYAVVDPRIRNQYG